PGGMSPGAGGAQGHGEPSDASGLLDSNAEPWSGDAESHQAEGDIVSRVAFPYGPGLEMPDSNEQESANAAETYTWVPGPMATSTFPSSSRRESLSEAERVDDSEATYPALGEPSGWLISSPSQSSNASDVSASPDNGTGQEASGAVSPMPSVLPAITTEQPSTSAQTDPSRGSDSAHASDSGDDFAAWDNGPGTVLAGWLVAMSSGGVGADGSNGARDREDRESAAVSWTEESADASPLSPWRPNRTALSSDRDQGQIRFDGDSPSCSDIEVEDFDSGDVTSSEETEPEEAPKRSYAELLVQDRQAWGTTGTRSPEAALDNPVER
ncbi:hypothetical protein ACWGJX_40240, partial [Streptomyces sp. NPDC054775]